MQYLLQGLKLILKPKLRRFIYVPILINLLVFICIWSGSMHYCHLLINWINSYLPNWLHWLDWLLWLIYFILSLLITAYTFTWLANLIAAPFYGLLSEAIQKHLQGKELPASNWRMAIPEALAAIKREWQKLKYYLPRALGLLLLTLIPGINIISSILWFGFGAWMQSLQYMDYPMDNNRHSLVELKKLLHANKLFSFSFGGTVMLLTMLPFINILVLPAAVAGATVKYCQDSSAVQ